MMVFSVYGDRLDIELVFKELKSRYAPDVVNMTNQNIVEVYILIIVLYTSCEQKNTQHREKYK